MPKFVGMVPPRIVIIEREPHAGDWVQTLNSRGGWSLGKIEALYRDRCGKAAIVRRGSTTDRINAHRDFLRVVELIERD